jgi:anti-sigma-K factor RskA
MIEDDDIDDVAGEYVLGTLDADERAWVERRRTHDRSLDAAIATWERRMLPLTDAVAGISPPSDLFTKIARRIDGDSATVALLRRRVNAWRASTFIASALAASLLALVVTKEFPAKPKQPNLVAVLQKDAASPAFLVTVNIDDRMMTVQPIAAKPAAGKSYELWLVQDSLGAPKSLGVVDDGQRTVRPTLTAYQRGVIESATYAISLEPEGGSPTGAPTGPVLFSGKLVAGKPN